MPRHHYITTYLLTALLATIMAACSDDIEPRYDYTAAGIPVTIEVPVAIPQMEVRSRADLADAYRNEVQSLLIATYSSVTGELTSMDASGKKGWVSVTPPTSVTEHAKYKFTLNTLSGPSYIVAVANVDNKGVLKSNPEEDEDKQKTLRQLLAEADTWPKFLNIATPSPSTQEYLNAPRVPLAMAGAYVNVNNDYTPEEWQHRNFDPYTIPVPTGTGKNVSMPGCIHLRRLVSQITFNIKTDKPDDIRITPHSYRVVNAPAFSWLYEREGNYGDDATFEDKGSYYKTSADFSSAFFTKDKNAESKYSFNFWIGENKHTGTIDAADKELNPYEQRDKYTLGTDGDKFFTSLTGDSWTVNNMASYVIINCTVEYKDPFKVDDNGNPLPDSSTELPSYRTGTANIIIHLGYLKDIATDFNSYRNVRYTYNVTVNGLNDIRLEAIGIDETPGMEGIVTDLQEPTINLDCHYQQFNVMLTKEELRKWAEHPGGTSEGFGFIITTYDNLNGGRQSYNESSPEFDGKTYDEVIAANSEIKKYIDWVEFRKTSDEKTYAAYEPRGGKSGETFNLLDASRGIDETKQRSESDWYTVFVKEYTYDYGNGANEASFVNGKPQWHGYVNADPRQFFIRVTKAVSDDSQSIYAHAKYAVSQNSIMTYYNLENITEIESGNTVQKRGSGIGIEHTNESFGLKLRRSYTASTDANNGRANCYKFTGYQYNNTTWQTTNRRLWNRYINNTTPQFVPIENKEEELQNLPQLTQYPGTKTTYATDPNQSFTSANNYIEAINACMNRNRDNDGDGTIDIDELRWYIPAMGKYLRMVLGSQSLGENAIIDFENITKLTVPNGYDFKNEYMSEYMFYSSDDRILWSMEGMSTSSYASLLDWSKGKQDNGSFKYPDRESNPWQVRCIRNLGTDLRSIANNGDPTIPAYVTEKKNSRTRIIPTYYNIANLRNEPVTGNGTGTQQMPVHSLVNYDYNAVYRFGFEIATSDATTINNVSADSWQNLRNRINGSNNPCNSYSDNSDSKGWRLPNLSEFAIMRNIGIFSTDWYLCCSMSAFDAGGNKVTPDDTDTGYNHYFLWALTNNITQAWNGTARIRCVRDITE